jgi:hypothetical protein
MTATINATTTTGVVVTSDTSGALALQTAGTTALTISSAQVVNFVNSFTVAGSPLASGFTLGTPVASTSGTSIDFTGIPSGIKQIIISFSNVSTSGYSAYLIQTGDSGGIETTGYSSRSVHFVSSGTAQFTNSTAGYVTRPNNTGGGASTPSGSITLTLENAGTFSWIATGILFNTSSDECAFNAGSKSLSAVLDRIRITTVNGTDAFDGGEINIAYI